MCERCCRVSNRPGLLAVAVVELDHVQPRRDGDVSPVRVDRQRRGVGRGLAVLDRVEVGAEQPEPRLPSPRIATSDPSSLIAAETTGPGPGATERNWPCPSIR